MLPWGCGRAAATCVGIKFYGASSSTPSTRCLLDGAPDALVGFHTGKGRRPLPEPQLADLQRLLAGPELTTRAPIHRELHQELVLAHRTGALPAEAPELALPRQKRLGLQGT